jgi:hypothetical protein
VRADQWKSVLVLVDGLYGDLPPLDGMAAIALRAELAFVDVGVAVGALLSDV